MGNVNETNGTGLKRLAFVLRAQEIDAKRRILIFEVLLQDVNLERGSVSASGYSAPSTSTLRDRPAT